MILELYKHLKRVAETEFGEIVEDGLIVWSSAGRARKLRLMLIDATYVDIWYSLDGQYSIHWEQSDLRNTIYRHDNDRVCGAINCHLRASACLNVQAVPTPRRLQGIAARPETAHSGVLSGVVRTGRVLLLYPAT